MKERSQWLLGLFCAACLLACSDDSTRSRDAGQTQRDGEAPDDAAAAEDAAKDDEPFPIRKVERSALTNVGTTGSLDYDNPAYWACRPDMDANECHANLDATEVKSDGTLSVVPHVRAEKPAFDCFYVYPTVLLTGAPQMVDFSAAGVKNVLDPLLAQAARFSSVCEVYAPLYRQVGLAGTAPAVGSSSQLALQDVRDAFAHYLEHFNRGRNFVLLGHSQGTFMLASMIKRDVDENAELRARLISALLLGGQPYTPAGQAVGGSFQNIPLCSAPDQTGCVIGFNAFAAEAPPSAMSVFGRVGTAFANEPPDLTGQVACVDPARIRGKEGPYGGSYFPLKLNNAMFSTPTSIPGVDTPFVLYRDLFRGECKLQNGAHYLEISLVAGDTRKQPSYRNATLEGVGFGLHLVDYDFALGDMIEIVKRQAAALEK
jgi:hypothetical protein